MCWRHVLGCLWPAKRDLLLDIGLGGRLLDGEMNRAQGVEISELMLTI